MALRKKTKPDKTRDGILDAALKLFSARGFQSTSMNDICSVAKLTKPTLYYHFPSKNRLLFEVHMRNIKEVLRPHIERVKSVDDPTMRLRMLIRDYTCIICSHPELRFLLHGSLTLKDKYPKEIRNEWKQHYELMRDTITELQRKKIIKPDISARLATLLLLGMISWITFWYDYGKGAPGKNSRGERLGNKTAIDEFADAVEEIAFDGLMS